MQWHSFTDFLACCHIVATKCSNHAPSTQGDVFAVALVGNAVGALNSDGPGDIKIASSLETSEF